MYIKCTNKIHVDSTTAFGNLTLKSTVRKCGSISEVHKAVLFLMTFIMDVVKLADVKN